MCASLGWDGWGCTDNTEAYSYGFQLLSTLLLCLSNLMFVPPVTIAIRSHYLLEASVYIFTMFFSTVSLKICFKPIKNAQNYTFQLLSAC